MKPEPILRRLVPLALCTAVLACLWSSHAAHAQIPDHFKNLKVLPKDISRQDLIQTMRGFSFALGVRCEHCHEPREGQRTSGDLKLDFASDHKPAKGTARQMMKMLRAINADYIDKLQPKAQLSVRCVTCHRGVPRPETLTELLGRVDADSGATVAVARYRVLREEYYGSGSYDFSEGTLNQLAEELLAEGKAQDALAFLNLNAENFADSGWLQSLFGDAYVATGDRDRARAAYEKALEKQPENPRLKKKLDDLESGESH